MDRDYLDEIVAQHTRRLAECTTPLFGHFDYKPEQFGSGVLLRIGDSHFLVTAAHVLDHFAAGPVYLPVPPGMPENGIPCRCVKAFQSQRHKDGGRENDNVDIAVAQFTDETARKLSSFMRFITLSDVETNPKRLEGGLLAFVGYPEGRCEYDDGYRTFDAQVLPYFGERDYTQRPGYDPLNTISICISETHTSDGHEYGFPLRELPNISGCGMWLTLGPDEPVESMDWRKMKLVAIVHSRGVEPNVVIGTTMNVVLKLLYERFEETRQEITMTVWS